MGDGDVSALPSLAAAHMPSRRGVLIFNPFPTCPACNSGGNDSEYRPKLCVARV